MDLYTRTALTNTRHSDLLREADAARLAADGAPAGIGMAMRARSDRLRSLIAKPRPTRTSAPSLRKAPIHS
jgi:hypothetical protein